MAVYTNAIGGRVKNAGDSTPLEGATIILLNTTNNTLTEIKQTDLDGYYYFVNLNIDDTYHVLCFYKDGTETYGGLSAPFTKPVAELVI